MKISAVPTVLTSLDRDEKILVVDTPSATPASAVTTVSTVLSYAQGGMSVEVLAAGTPLATGDGKAYAIIPAALDGMNLISVGAAVFAKSTSGTPTIQLARGRQAAAGTAHAFADMLSTRITIDVNEFDSKDATTAAVIDTANDDVLTGDLIRVDVDVAGTGVTGLWVRMTFRKP